MDLIDYRKDTLDRLAGRFLDFAAPLGVKSIEAIPISARLGDKSSVDRAKPVGIVALVYWTISRASMSVPIASVCHFAFLCNG